MKTVILAGGLGTRLSEETTSRPKPMVEIGGKPILWHILNLYSANGFDDFVIACGYKGEVIKEYFQNFVLHNSDCVFDLRNGKIERRNSRSPDWRVAAVDTGIPTMTGGRLARLRPWLGRDSFMMTYGDGLADIDLKALVAFHRKHKRIATVTAVRPPARFGGLALEGYCVTRFTEKPQAGEGWINGGFFVFEKGIFDFLDGDDCVLEREPLERLSAAGELVAFKHDGFWQPMDTLRDKQALEAFWASGKAPWRKK